MARHKPAKEGGYQRGEETRLRIIESAVRLFGERGFDGASTREIAAMAGVNAPALQYYFDNKEGVYLACVKQLIIRVNEHLVEPLAVAHRALDSIDSSDESLIAACQGILATFLGLIQETPQSEDWRRFMAREKAGLGPPSAFDLMERDLSEPLALVTRGLIARLTGKGIDDDVTIIRSLSLNSQGLVFRTLRRPALKALGWESFDRQGMETVREVVLGQTRLMLQGLVNEREMGGLR